MTERRAKTRPKHLDPPAYLGESPPLPDPAAGGHSGPAGGGDDKLDPTRYGDWEKNGIAVDF